jgi:hypothetical protein
MLPGAAETEGLQLVYDTADRRASVAAPPIAGDLITVPRYVLYTQGALLGVVALVAFTLGALAGSAVLSPAPPQTEPCTIRGSVTFTSGPRMRADAGAAIALLPQTAGRWEERAPVAGLGPGDSPLDDDQRGLSIIRAAGGACARADLNGRFELRLPHPGRYWLLVVSHERRADQKSGLAADVRNLTRFFDNPGALLAGHTYRLSSEIIRVDKQINVVFE